MDDLAEAYHEAGINLGAAIKSLCRWGSEALAFHLTGRATNGRSEGVNTKIECLERMAYGFSNRPNYEVRVLLVCSGHPVPVT